jgi:hypothetical protein
MNVSQVRAVVQDWVDTYGSRTPGFCGAHLMGGILVMAPTTVFPATDDVDFNLVVSGTPEQQTYNLAYQGLILEYSVVGSALYRSPDAVLANPELASNLAADSVLADPVQLLGPVHAVVARDYARRTWVQACCAYEKKVVEANLEALAQAVSPAEAVWPLAWTMVYLAGLLDVATLRPPTHRRSLIHLREVLLQQGREEWAEEALGLLGYAALTHGQVAAYLQDAATAFDRAVAVKRMPVPLDFKFQAHVRPYLIDGVAEMVAQGHHREAMIVIVMVLSIASSILQQNAPTEQPVVQAMLDRLMQEVGWGDPQVLAARVRGAEDLASRIVSLADALVLQRPDDAQAAGTP